MNFGRKGLELGKDINPSAVEYGEVQQGTAAKTVDREEKNVQREDEKQRKRHMKNLNLL